MIHVGAGAEPQHAATASNAPQPTKKNSKKKNANHPGAPIKGDAQPPRRSTRRAVKEEAMDIDEGDYEDDDGLSGDEYYEYELQYEERDPRDFDDYEDEDDEDGSSSPNFQVDSMARCRHTPRMFCVFFAHLVALVRLFTPTKKWMMLLQWSSSAS